ncbi:MAG TPA: hypothetical protein PL082_06340, partial [Tepidiformaceae bacterium]|nr:hypothetical protein [Tepidiformaceae bacterium]
MAATTKSEAFPVQPDGFFMVSPCGGFRAATPDLELARANATLVGGRGQPKAFRRGDRGLLVDLVKNRGKFVAAETRDRVGRPLSLGRVIAPDRISARAVSLAAGFQAL